MGDTLIEKIIIITSPIGLIIVLIGFILDLWEKHLWCNKRWYWNYYDYLMTKKAFKKGLDEKQKLYFKRWINANVNNPYIEKYKALLIN